ncbi:hypothetical protein SAMN05444672_108153 [Bacillus sp. OK838]|nr:hypothetical protein SAMN05444672_108153 [Bacillus sp. OK838]
MTAFLESFNNVGISVYMTGAGVRAFLIQMLMYVENYFDPTRTAHGLVLFHKTIKEVMMDGFVHFTRYICSL